MKNFFIVLAVALTLGNRVMAQGDLDITKVKADLNTKTFNDGKHTVTGYIYSQLESATACCGNDAVFLEVKVNDKGCVVSAKTLTGKYDCYKKSICDIVKNVQWDATGVVGQKTIYIDVKPIVPCSGQGDENQYKAVAITNNPCLGPTNTDVVANNDNNNQNNDDASTNVTVANNDDHVDDNVVVNNDDNKGDDNVVANNDDNKGDDNVVANNDDNKGDDNVVANNDDNKGDDNVVANNDDKGDDDGDDDDDDDDGDDDGDDNADLKTDVVAQNDDNKTDDKVNTQNNNANTKTDNSGFLSDKYSLNNPPQNNNTNTKVNTQNPVKTQPKNTPVVIPPQKSIEYTSTGDHNPDPSHKETHKNLDPDPGPVTMHTDFSGGASGTQQLAVGLKSELRKTGYCGLVQASIEVMVTPQGKVVSHRIMASNSDKVSQILPNVVPLVNFQPDSNKRWNYPVYFEFKTEIICDGKGKYNLDQVPDIIH